MARLGTNAVSLWNKDRLIVVRSKCSGKVILNESVFAAALASAADLQRFRCLQYERLIITAGPKGGKYRLGYGQRTCVTAVL